MHVNKKLVECVDTLTGNEQAPQYPAAVLVPVVVVEMGKLGLSSSRGYFIKCGHYGFWVCRWF